MKKILLSTMFAAVAMLSSAATATYSAGKLTLDFIGDWAVVENGTGDITIVNGDGLQLASVIGTPEYDISTTTDYQVLVYNVAGRLDAGDYTVKIADGAIVGHKTAPWSFDLSSIGALDLSLSVTDAGGSADEPESAAFNEPTITLIAGAGINVKFTYPDSVEPEGYNKSAGDGKSATLYEDGVQVATAAFGFQMEPDFFFGVHFDQNITEGHQYKVVFEAGCWYIEKIDDMGNSTIELTSEEVTYSWTGGENAGNIDDGQQPGEDPVDPGQDPEQPQSPVNVEFLLGTKLAAITNNLAVAEITVDRAYYDLYWTVTCPDDPDFFFGGSSHAASQGAGTYAIIASTPSAEPVVLNSDRTYIFSFQTCEFGWDGYKTVATFSVEGTGAAAEQFSDIVITDFDGTLGTLGYNFKKTYTVTFSAPVTSVKAFTPEGMDGSSSFPVAAADNEGLKWTIDVSHMANDEGAFELHIQAVDAATGLRLLGTYHLDNSFIYTIFISANNPDDEPGQIDPELPGEELDIAAIRIGREIYKLSEKQAIELDAYPAGSVLNITLGDEAIKKVSYEIIDHTTGDILKSIADLNKGDDGQWYAEMPLTYQFAAGHEYYIHIVARDGMSSFTSKVLYEYNFLVNGTADVAQYSTVKVTDITPSTSEILTEAEPVITITFSEPIAQLTATAILGQMSKMKISADRITTADNQTWQIAMPAEATVTGSLSVDIVAIDLNGNRVTDAVNGVGLPENCYLNYGWASVIGLPTPKMTEAGTTVQSLTALTFTYDGIGLNQDNNTATWQQITISRDDQPLDLTITESMFAVSGDASVGGSILTLTLPEALTQAGVYTIQVPAYAFMLGHDQSNWLSGNCTFTVTVEGTATAIRQIVNGGEDALYLLNGSKANATVKGSLYIMGGQKVIIK